MKTILLCLTAMMLNVQCYSCWVMTDINTKMLANSVYADERLDDRIAESLQKQFLIFPGTKWCGAGNSADNYDDLGPERETDMCCREHDHCPDVIAGGETKHNLTNTAFYTRLHCECDEVFHDCLKAANTTTSKLIGSIYFNALMTKCFREDYPIDECIKKGGLFNTKCVEYSYHTNETKLYQWFDVPVFSLSS
ncbi:phospholipase A2-like [Anticarsia gemmatalis]|uniref:phospholipase A2-like n=1 Tax=Anticarsia gemmatalis TaxID=129554 RepID=UPI003F764C74